MDDPRVAQASEDLFRRLEEAGLETLYDDRQETAGVKFNDADLLGFPIRVVVGSRSLNQAAAEVKRREEKGRPTGWAG